MATFRKTAFQAGICTGLFAMAAFWMSRRTVIGPITGRAIGGIGVNPPESIGRQLGNHTLNAGVIEVHRVGSDSAGGAIARDQPCLEEVRSSAPPAIRLTESPRSYARRHLVQLAVVLVLAPLVYWGAAGSYRMARLGRHQPFELPKALSAGAEPQTQPDQPTRIDISIPHQDPLTADGGGFDVEIRNVGTIPAVGVSLVDYVLIEELDELSSAEEVSNHTPFAIGTLTPGSAFTANVRFHTTAEGISSVAAGRMRVVNYARATYEDSYHRKYATTLCYYWHGQMQAPLRCQDLGTTR